MSAQSPMLLIYQEAHIQIFLKQKKNHTRHQNWSHQQQPTRWKQSEYSKHCQILYMSDHSSGPKPLYIGLRNELSYLENSRFYFDMDSAVICIHGQLSFLHLSFQYKQSSQAVSCQPLSWETHSKAQKKKLLIH